MTPDTSRKCGGLRGWQRDATEPPRASSTHEEGKTSERRPLARSSLHDVALRLRPEAGQEKVSSSTQSTNGATLYITLSPCKECSKLIFQSGIKRVVYNKKYKDTSGLEFLEKAGVETCLVSI